MNNDKMSAADDNKYYAEGTEWRATEAATPAPTERQREINACDHEMSNENSGSITLCIHCGASELAAKSAALACNVPEGCTPADARHLREANFALITENADLRARLASAGAGSELTDAVGKLIKAKGRFHTEQNYKAVVEAYDAALARTTNEGKQNG